MALSAELLKKFKLENVPLQDKLLAARTLFVHSEFFYISRKEELVLDWLLELASHKLQNDSHHYVWQTIQYCLQSENMKKLTVVEIKSETKEMLVQLLVRSLTSQLHEHTQKRPQNSLHVTDFLCERKNRVIRECSILTVENTSFLYYFRKNIDKYVELSRLILKSAAENGDGETVISYVKAVVCFYDQSQKRGELFQVFVGKLLFPIVEAFCLLKRCWNTGSSSLKLEGSTVQVDVSITNGDIDGVRTEVLHLIEQVIFPSFSHRSFKTNLEHLFEKNIVGSPLQLLCRILVKHAASHHEVTFDLYTLVFEAFVFKFQNDFNVIYRFYVTLCLLLGFEIRIKKESDSKEICLLTKGNISKALNLKISGPVKGVSLLVIQEMINIMKKTTLVLDDIINEISYKQWMQALTIDLVNTFNTSCVIYRIMHTIIELNPLIIVPITNQVLTNVLLKPKATPEEREQYKIFFHGMFKMFVKLQRLQSFVCSNLFPTLKQVIEENRFKNIDILDITGSDVIPDGFVGAFGSAVGNFYGHMVSLLREFNYSLTQNVIVPLEEGHVDGGHLLFLEVLENLLVPFLGGIRIAEQTVVEGVCKRFLNYLTQLRTCLGRLGIALIQHEHDSRSLASFLHICLAVGEMQLVLLLYSPWSGENEQLQVAPSINHENATDLQCLLSFLGPQQWNDIAQRAVDMGDETCQEALYALLQQQLRALLLFENNIENSKQLQSTVCDYLIEHLKDVQLLQRSSDAAVLVPLLSHEKLISVAENITEHLVVSEPNSRVFSLLKDPVLGENKPLLVSLAWKTMQKISHVLSKRKRTHNSEAPKLSHRRLVKDMCLSVNFSDILGSGEKVKVQESFLEIAKKINEAFNDLLQADHVAVDGMPLDLVKLSKHVILLRSLPFPFLPQNTQTFLALGILGVIIVLNELLKKCSVTIHSRTKKEDSTSQSQFISLNNSCREILLGLVDSPTPASLFDLVDVGMLVRLLHQDGQCPKLLLQLLFEDCVEKPERLPNIIEAVCLVDDYVMHNISGDTPPISAFLLQLLMKKNLSNVTKEVRETYKKNIHQLLEVISRRIDSQMKSENASEASVLALLTAYWCVFSSHSVPLFKMMMPYVKNFLSCAFSVLENPDVHQESVPMAELVLEVILGNYKKIEKEVCSKALWKAYKSLDRPRLVTKLLKNAAPDDFKLVLEDLCHPLESDHPKEFPDLRLPKSLVTMPMEHSKALSVEQLVVLISSAAYKKIMQGASDDRLPEFLAFLLSVAKRTKVPLPYELADIILTTIVCALKVQPMSHENVLSTSTIAIQLLSKMVMNHFPLINDRVAAFMLVYRMVVHAVVTNSAVELQLSDEEAQKFARCALDIERLSKSLGDHSQDFKAVSQHMVADMLQEFEQTAIHHKVKIHIMNSLYALMDLCDRFAFAHLTYALPPASLELFKTAMSNYKKFYKYTGRV